MLQSFGFEQAAERLGIDEAEFGFLVHHFWEYLSQAGTEARGRTFSGGDLQLLHRVLNLYRGQGLEMTEVRQQIRHEVSALGADGIPRSEILGFCTGRTGSGSSTLIWNLAAALAQRGYRCTIFDGTLGAGGVEKLIYGDQECRDWCRVLDSGVRLVSGARLLGLVGEGGNLFDLDRETCHELQRLERASDFVLLDTGDGRSDNALRFGSLVDQIIMVTTADVGVNADSFSVVRMLRDVDPGLPLGLVINRAASLGDAREAFSRMAGAAKHINLTDVPGLGWIIEDEALRRCMATGEAIIETLPTSPAARCIMRLADSLANRLVPLERRASGGLRELVQALANLSYRSSAVRDV